jgi:hypothetical protein
LVVGNVNGEFQAVFGKIAGLHAKNKFAFALIVGNLFAHPDTYSEDDTALRSLVNGGINVPVTTYFALGSHALPSVVLEKLQSSDDELCHNLFFLGECLQELYIIAVLPH